MRTTVAGLPAWTDIARRLTRRPRDPSTTGRDREVHAPSGNPPGAGGVSEPADAYLEAGGLSTTMGSKPLQPSSDIVSSLGRALSDLGLAGLLGGQLFGRLALHPAVT